jgi:hypothetical protein
MLPWWITIGLVFFGVVVVLVVRMHSSGRHRMRVSAGDYSVESLALKASMDADSAARTVQLFGVRDLINGYGLNDVGEISEAGESRKIVRPYVDAEFSSRPGDDEPTVTFPCDVTKPHNMWFEPAEAAQTNGPCQTVWIDPRELDGPCRLERVISRSQSTQAGEAPVGELGTLASAA